MSSLPTLGPVRLRGAILSASQARAFMDAAQAMAGFGGMVSAVLPVGVNRTLRLTCTAGSEIKVESLHGLWTDAVEVYLSIADFASAYGLS